MLSLERVSKTVPGGRVLFKQLSLSLAPGEFVAIMGESGAGKSTLLNLVAGLDTADAGSIRFEGTDLKNLDDDARTLLRRDRMGFVFQAFHVLPYLTVEQNVALPLDLLGVTESARTSRTLEMLEAVGIAPLARRYARELSGGEVQRIAIARALVHKPRLVLADEPTGNLDPRSAAQTLQLLRTQVKANAGAGILITHSRTAAETADRILVLDMSGLKPLSPTPEPDFSPARGRDADPSSGSGA